MTRSGNGQMPLSGNVYSRHEIDLANDSRSYLELEPEGDPSAGGEVVAVGGAEYAVVRKPFEVGDVAIYPRLDMFGRMALAGGHSNHGYSVYFRATIFDGSRWRNFQIWDFVPSEDRQYANQGEKTTIERRLIATINAQVGAIAVWGSRTYALRVDAT